jgi:uncharacterized protein (DUF58 family)
MIPTQRVYWLLGLGTAIAALLATLPPEEGQIPRAIVGTLLFDGIVIALMLWDGWRVSPVSIGRTPLQRLSIGRENPVHLTVCTGNQAATIQIQDAYPPEFEVSTGETSGNVSAADAVGAFSGLMGDRLHCTLPAESTQTLTYAVRPLRRGEFSWGNIHLRQQGAWGLAWRDWVIPQSQTVAVYPDLVGLRELSIRLTLQSTGVMRRMQHIGIGTEFAELREYGTGDDLRFVDWKATARRGRPLVRVLEPELEQTLIILLDRGRLMTAHIQGLTRFDWGMKATLSLALAGLNRGDRVGVGVFDRTIHTWLAPERGINQLSRIIDRLTPIQPDLLEPDYFAAATALVNQQTRRALVVLITDVIDQTASAELLAAMGRLTSRYLPFCVALGDPSVHLCAHTPTQDVASTYARAVALDLLAQRHVALATLQRRGVLVLDAPATQLSEQLVDRYLQLKAQGKL